MKKYFLFSLFIFINTLAFSQVTNNETKADSTGITKTVQYTCSMHSEILSDKPGNCPKCGMQLVEKSKVSDNKKMKMMHGMMMMDGMNDSTHKKQFPKVILMGGMMAVAAIIMMVARSR